MSLSKSYLHDILAKAKLDVTDTTTLRTVENSNIDTDKFLVIEDHVVKYRTGEQLLADLGVIGLNMTTIVEPLYFQINNGVPTLFITKADTDTNGYLSFEDWNTFNNKQPFITPGTNLQYWRGDKTWQILDTLVVPENTNLYFTTARSRQSISLTTLNSSGSSTYDSGTGVINVPTYTLSGLGGEPYITPGTNLQYWRGDKTWQTLDTSIVPENTNLYYTQGRFDLAFAAKSTTNLAEGLNLYYTNERARASITLTTTGSSGVASYFSDTGILNIPNYTLSGLGGVPSTRTLTINGVTYDLSANRSWSIVAGVSSITTNLPLHSTNVAGDVTISIYQANASVDGYLSSTDWNTFNSKEPAISSGSNTQYWRGDKSWQTLNTSVVTEGTNLYFTDLRARTAISLTTNGNSGSATYSTSTGIFNIPEYTLTGLGGVPSTRTITIDGVTYDLSINRTWNVLPALGTAGQILAKIDGTSYNTEWIDNYTSSVKHLVRLSEAMTIGTAVYVSSANGTNMVVSKASNVGESTSSKTMGLIAFSGSANAQGFLITEGLLTGINTSLANPGDPVWLGVNGQLLFGLSNKPQAPAHMVFLGIVTRVQQNNGEIFVKVQNGFELQELHNVYLNGTANNEILVYESSTSLWKAKSISTILGYTPVSTTSNLTTSYIPKASGATSLINSNISDDGTTIKLNSNTRVTGNLQIDGNFVVGGTTTTVGAINLSVSDNMIYLNNAIETTITNVVGNGTTVTYTADNNYVAGMSVTITGVNPSSFNLSNQTIVSADATSFTINSTVIATYIGGGTARAKSNVNPDLGWAAGYNDGTYHHTGLFRDATDGVYKFFQGYIPEPDASIFIDTSDPSFELAQVQASKFIGPLQGNADTVTNGVYTSRTLTINGVTYDLSANRTWTITAGVSSVTASSPLTSSGGSTPNISISQATSTVNGYLSFTDWTTFNSKQNAITLTTTGTSGAATLVGSTLNIPQYQAVLTNPITGTGTTNYIPKFTGSTTLGNSVIQDNGTLVFLGNTVGIGTTTVSSGANLEIRGSSGAIVRLTKEPAYGNVQNAVLGRIEFYNYDVDVTPGVSSYIGASYEDIYGQLSYISIGTSAYTGLAERIRISAFGQIKFNTYTSATAWTGTIAGYLAIDSSGNLITAVGAGSGTVNYIPKWTTTTSLTNSQITDNGTLVTLGSAVGIGTGAISSGANLEIKTSSGGILRISRDQTSGFVQNVSLGKLEFYNYDADVPGPLAGAFVSASYEDLYGQKTYLSFGTDPLAGAVERVRIWSTGQVRFNTYTSSTSWSGTAVAGLAIDSSGNIITTSNPIGGSGTTNYVPKFTPNGTTLGNSLIFDNGTSVGINTITPNASYKLDVNGSVNFYNSTTGATVFTVQGTTGQLFAVSDITTGVLLQVNDVSGLPLMGINANGALYMYSASATGISTSPYTIYVLDKTTGTAAYFDYRITNTTNSGWRAGTVMVVWDGTNVEFTDTSTNDITATTSGLSWSASINGSNLQLSAIITSGTWNIKIGARVI